MPGNVNNTNSSLDSNLQALVQGAPVNGSAPDKGVSPAGLNQLSNTSGQNPVPAEVPAAVGSDAGAIQTVSTQAPVSAPVSSPISHGTGAINVLSKLIEKGVIDTEKYKALKFESASTGRSAESLAVEKGLISENDLFKTKSEITGIPFIELGELVISTEIIQKIPFEAAQKNSAIAFELVGDYIKVAMTDPIDIQKVNYIEAVIGKKIAPYYATPTDIKKVLDTKYSVKIEEEVTEALEDVGEAFVIGPVIGKEQDLSGADLGSAPVSRIVNMVLEYATRFNASDIHIEPRESKVAVRYRLNGVLSERLTLPRKLSSSIVSRLKILSNLKIDEHRVPQDGRFQIKVADRAVDIRISIMPSIYGEKVVMRLLEKGGGIMNLEDTGLRGTSLKTYREALAKTQGIVLVTGPTGSGKTQTLASSLKILNTQEVNIMTLEDPVEIRVEGVTQVQINEEVGLSFANGLRSFLRQDPDIIMVGEIRDAETAALAVQAALTGHLVLATLHTNSAAGALPRLLDMGVEPFLLASTINVSVGQRLVRKICENCKEKYIAPPPIVEKIHKVLAGLKGFDMFSYPKSFDPASVPGKVSTKDTSQIPSSEIIKMQAVKPPSNEVYLYRGKGCPKCGDTGYQGRMAIFETLGFNEKIGRLVMEHRSVEEIEKMAIEKGMETMIQDGFMKALDGLTTVEEILRVANK
ncbi:type II/IV secretion system protein [Candidatus Dojkabacteria bacterium]|nr:type II/IV secretion system protein [Candidatus Dojkabacteria bacterium]